MEKKSSVQKHLLVRVFPALQLLICAAVFTLGFPFFLAVTRAGVTPPYSLMAWGFSIIVIGSALSLWKPKLFFIFLIGYVLFLKGCADQTSVEDARNLEKCERARLDPACRLEDDAYVCSRPQGEERISKAHCDR